MPRRKKEYYSEDDDDSDYASKGGKFGKPPIQRNTANARERARMRVLSKAFSKLKTTLPWVPADTKLSKLDTLRLASSYIAHLRQVLNGEDDVDPQTSFIHPLNLTWPFSFSAKSGSGTESKSPEPIKMHNDRMISPSDDMMS
ncbi:Hypothetical predicted protein [Mytilus galloprovincialis]|uniref:BHLH domain-containing protein n=1 Tax=Mytilus galloprovincialis TaxID=29158 RepID=A0A8B6GVL6_MYTGA|nr:Hypothetical predicted protein [Mytilus galloprovincialis]